MKLKKVVSLILCSSLLACAGGCGEKENPKVNIEFENGKNITMELYPDVAPKTVKNFVKLVEEGFYDGLTIHRIVPGFVIQGGDPLGNGTGGSDEHIKGEFLQNGVKNDLAHERGVVSMARASDFDSASSQFFIVLEDAPHLDGSYAAFGRVIEGMEVADEIAEMDVDYYGMPFEKVVMKKVTMVK